MKVLKKVKAILFMMLGYMMVSGGVESWILGAYIFIGMLFLTYGFYLDKDNK